MSIPRNETAEDLRAERQVAEDLARAWSCEVQKITEDRLFLADYAVISKGEVVAFVEIRVRHCSRNTYPTIYLPLQKVIWAESVFAASCVPYFYVVLFEEDATLAYIRVTGHFRKPQKVVWVRRKKERETHPDGPVVEVRTEDFTLIRTEEAA